MMLYEFLTTIPVNGENRGMSHCLRGAIFFSAPNELRSQTGAKIGAGLAECANYQGAGTDGQSANPWPPAFAVA